MSHENNKTKIQDAAFALFLEKGYEATSVRAICRRAGIEEPTLYYFFGSKKGLLLSVANRIRGLYQKYSSQINEQVEEMAPQEKLYAIFYSIMRYTLGNMPEVRFFYRFTLFPPAGLAEEIEAYVDLVLENDKQLVKECIGESIALGVEIDPEVTYQRFWQFVVNSCIDVFYLNWRPAEIELRDYWDMFYTCRILGLH